MSIRHITKTSEYFIVILLTLLAQYEAQGLCNGRVSVRPSVCPVYRLLQQHVAGLLLGALQAGNNAQQQWQSVANASSVTFTATVYSLLTTSS